MRSLALFKPTFQRLQKALEQGNQITQNVLPITYGSQGFEKLENIFLNLNCLEYAAADLQSPEVEAQLALFENFLDVRKMTVSYDYQMKGYRLINQYPINDKIEKLVIDLRSIRVENIDHPILRQSLYFHELKDIDKIATIKYPPNAPKFVRDMIKRNAENTMLDSQNPLGVPIKAPALQFMLQFNDKFAIQLYCRFGNVNIKTIRSLKSGLDQKGQPKTKCNYLLDGLNVPRPIQSVVYGVIQEELGLGQTELFHLHKIAYIGGRVEQLQGLLSLQQIFTHALEQQ